MYYVYAISSQIKKFTYVGFTDNLKRRVFQHNSGYNKSTRAYAPFKLIYYEKVETSEKAREREKFLKSGKGREYLETYKQTKCRATEGGQVRVYPPQADPAFGTKPHLDDGVFIYIDGLLQIESALIAKLACLHAFVYFYGKNL